MAFSPEKRHQTKPTSRTMTVIAAIAAAEVPAAAVGIAIVTRTSAVPSKVRGSPEERRRSAHRIRLAIVAVHPKAELGKACTLASTQHLARIATALGKRVDEVGVLA